MTRSGMSRTQQVALLVLVPLVAVAGLLVGRSMRGGETADTFGVSRADDAVEFAHDFVIPPGTAGRIAAGETVEIVPAELVVRVGDAIRIVNDDSDDHVVGVFFVAAGETLTQRFTSEGVLEGECSVHSSGAFTLRVVA